VKALITTKLGMTTAIDQDGSSYAWTLLRVDNNTVLGHKTAEKDGYQAVIVGSGQVKKLAKSLAGQVKAAKAYPKVIREFKIINKDDSEGLSVGEAISADVFSIGDKVGGTGTSKGKGWAGTIRRHNFHRGRKTHGGRSYRRPGSIGSMYPQKIFKGKKMAGQMGHSQVTVRNLKVALVDNEHKVIGVTGAVPGPRRGIVIIKGA